MHSFFCGQKGTEMPHEPVTDLIMMAVIVLSCYFSAYPFYRGRKRTETTSDGPGSSDEE